MKNLWTKESIFLNDIYLKPQLQLPPQLHCLASALIARNVMIREESTKYYWNEKNGRKQTDN